MCFSSLRARILGLLLAAWGAGSAWSQLPPAAPPAAAASTAAAPRSAFDSYRRHDEPQAVPWRTANDTVGQVGGWRAYAREAQGLPPATAASAPVPSPHHGGHR